MKSKINKKTIATLVGLGAALTILLIYKKSRSTSRLSSNLIDLKTHRPSKLYRTVGERLNNVEHKLEKLDQMVRSQFALREKQAGEILKNLKKLTRGERRRPLFLKNTSVFDNRRKRGKYRRDLVQVSGRYRHAHNNLPVLSAETSTYFDDHSNVSDSVSGSEELSSYNDHGDDSSSFIKKGDENYNYLDDGINLLERKNNIQIPNLMFNPNFGQQQTKSANTRKNSNQAKIQLGQTEKYDTPGSEKQVNKSSSKVGPFLSDDKKNESEKGKDSEPKGLNMSNELDKFNVLASNPFSLKSLVDDKKEGKNISSERFKGLYHLKGENENDDGTLITGPMFLRAKPKSLIKTLTVGHLKISGLENVNKEVKKPTSNYEKSDKVNKEGEKKDQKNTVTTSKDFVNQSKPDNKDASDNKLKSDNTRKLDDQQTKKKTPEEILKENLVEKTSQKLTPETKKENTDSTPVKSFMDDIIKTSSRPIINNEIFAVPSGLRRYFSENVLYKNLDTQNNSSELVNNDLSNLQAMDKAVKPVTDQNLYETTASSSSTLPKKETNQVEPSKNADNQDSDKNLLSTETPLNKIENKSVSTPKEPKIKDDSEDTSPISNSETSKNNTDIEKSTKSTEESGDSNKKQNTDEPKLQAKSDDVLTSLIDPEGSKSQNHEFQDDFGLSQILSVLTNNDNKKETTNTKDEAKNDKKKTDAKKDNTLKKFTKRLNFTDNTIVSIQKADENNKNSTESANKDKIQGKKSKIEDIKKTRASNEKKEPKSTDHTKTKEFVEFSNAVDNLDRVFKELSEFNKSLTETSDMIKTKPESSNKKKSTKPLFPISEEKSINDTDNEPLIKTKDQDELIDLSNYSGLEPNNDDEVVSELKKVGISTLPTLKDKPVKDKIEKPLIQNGLEVLSLKIDGKVGIKKNNDKKSGKSEDKKNAKIKKSKENQKPTKLVLSTKETVITTNTVLNDESKNSGTKKISADKNSKESTITENPTVERKTGDKDNITDLIDDTDTVEKKSDISTNDANTNENSIVSENIPKPDLYPSKDDTINGEAATPVTRNKNSDINLTGDLIMKGNESLTTNDIGVMSL